jgi:hypothetical protein
MAVTSGACRLKSGQLGAWDLTVSTGAKIGPGTSTAIGTVLFVLAWVAGILSVLAASLADSNSQAGNA